ncbi:MAG: DNA mismatch repair endonuclease MutL, partial [Candidatus Cloacimonetes bacterium]|nr:DNA mismatch repair endonuclease MutL [Candidatus Cloacimonadota bacterium]
MAKISILSEDVRNKIAAGEVIERPSSVVKELVENSIDAKAKSITVIVENGGKDLIQVIDDGLGMEPDDAMLALESHATSKIRNVEDIVHINSLGFRGEALPSIAAVSHFTMVTRSSNLDVATRIEINDGKLRDVQKTSSNPGTTIWVRGLFKNLPARRKFLRSESVELRHILKYFHYQAIIYPNISFKLIADTKTKLNYIGTDDRNQRMSEIFGAGFLQDDLILVNGQNGDYGVEGYIFGLEDRRDKL